jgi:thermostable 8-oxoguanine DNA glycosylase
LGRNGFLFFTGGCSARMGLRSVEAVRPLLLAGNHAELADALRGRHRYPNARAGYIVASREFFAGTLRFASARKLESLTTISSDAMAGQGKTHQGFGL